REFEAQAARLGEVAVTGEAMPLGVESERADEAVTRQGALLRGSSGHGLALRGVGVDLGDIEVAVTGLVREAAGDAQCGLGSLILVRRADLDLVVQVLQHR